MAARRNHIRHLLAHIPDRAFWFHGPQRKLAQAIGMSEPRLSRIINGRVKPRYDEVLRLVAFFEECYQRRIDPREIYDMGAISKRPRRRGGGRDIISD